MCLIRHTSHAFHLPHCWTDSEAWNPRTCGINKNTKGTPERFRQFFTDSSDSDFGGGGVRLDTPPITSLYWFGYERVGRLIKDASYCERERPVSQYLVLRFPLTNLPFLVALRLRDSLKSDTAVFNGVGNQWPCKSSGRTSRNIVSRAGSPRRPQGGGSG